MRPFEGFPAGRTTFTPIPDLFYSQLLPQIDDLIELKITLHIFWLLHKKKGYPRSVSLPELSSDGVLLSGLQTPGASQTDVLRQGLHGAVQRGTLIDLISQTEDEEIEWYFLNTSQGRKAVQQIRRGHLSLPDVGRLVEPRVAVARPNIFELYEQNIGLLQPIIAEQLQEAEDAYPADWIEEAFTIAAEQNVRNWRYISAILDRWLAEGKD